MLGTLKGFVTRHYTDKAAREALNWLDAHQQHFRISADSKQDIPWRIKPIIELTFLLTSLKRNGVQDRALDRLSQFALAEAATFDWHQLASFDPSAATPLALIADFFALENQPPPFEMAYFDYLRQIEFFEGMDRVPYREMDLIYCYDCIGIPDPQRRMQGLFDSTAFGRRQIPARYTINDLYSLTHAIFYLTSVGQHSAAKHLDADTLARLNRELVSLTALMMRGDNVDVLGELLMCWYFCGIVPTEFERTIFTAGLERVLGSITPDGAIASTRRLKKRSETGEATFSELYHTTLVASLLFSLVAKRKL
ncbi:DUF6895 family protein [Pyxidicoccus sp. 3LFB2]